MSIATAADLDRAIRTICEEHGVTRQQLRGICDRLLAEDGDPRLEKVRSKTVDKVDSSISASNNNPRSS